MHLFQPSLDQLEAPARVTTQVKVIKIKRRMNDS